MDLYGLYFIIAFAIFAYSLHSYITKKTAEHDLNRHQYKETYYPEPNIFITILVCVGFAILLASTIYFMDDDILTIIGFTIGGTIFFTVIYILAIRKIECSNCNEKMKFQSFTNEEKPNYYRYCDICKLKYDTGIGRGDAD